LLAGPTQEGLTTPFPNGVTLQSWEWDEELDGNIKVRLSEQYSDLTDISLTLADYCIVLTLTQIDGVESVELISNSYSASYRSHQILTADEVLLS
jgi:spore germination protein GerM